MLPQMSYWETRNINNLNIIAYKLFDIIRDFQMEGNKLNLHMYRVSWSSISNYGMIIVQKCDKDFNNLVRLYSYGNCTSEAGTNSFTQNVSMQSDYN